MGVGYWCGADADLLNAHCPKCGKFVIRTGPVHHFYCFCGWEGTDPVPPLMIPSSEKEEWAAQAARILDTPLPDVVTS